MISILSNPPVFAACAALLGLCVGSFLNVVIHRLPKMMERQWRAECAELAGQESAPGPRYNLVVPRSACPSCGHAISALENIPLLSWLVLGGKCKGCKTSISRRYPAVELLTGLLSGFIAWHFGFSVAAAGALLFTWAMIALTFIDLDTFYLPDSITLPLLWLGLLFNISATYVSLSSAVIGAAAAADARCPAAHAEGGVRTHRQCRLNPGLNRLPALCRLLCEQIRAPRLFRSLAPRTFRDRHRCHIRCTAYHAHRIQLRCAVQDFGRKRRRSGRPGDSRCHHSASHR